MSDETPEPAWKRYEDKYGEMSPPRKPSPTNEERARDLVMSLMAIADVRLQPAQHHAAVERAIIALDAAEARGLERAADIAN